MHPASFRFALHLDHRTASICTSPRPSLSLVLLTPLIASSPRLALRLYHPIAFICPSPHHFWSLIFRRPPLDSSLRLALHIYPWLQSICPKPQPLASPSVLFVVLLRPSSVPPYCPHLSSVRLRGPPSLVFISSSLPPLLPPPHPIVAPHIVRCCLSTTSPLPCLSLINFSHLSSSLPSPVTHLYLPLPRIPPPPSFIFHSPQLACASGCMWERSALHA